MAAYTKLVPALTRRGWALAATLLVVLAVSVPPLAWLCLGRTPSLLSPANLPVWERQTPRSMPLKGKRAVSPFPPGAVLFSGTGYTENVLNPDEDALLRPLEHPYADASGNAGRAGRWLELMSATGRRDPTLRATQNRVAGRILAAQLTSGWFGSAPGNSTSGWAAQASTLRGLATFAAMSGSGAALYAAWHGAQAAAGAPFSPPDKGRLVLPLCRVYGLTGDSSLLQWCEKRAYAGQADTEGLCALYDATGDRWFLTRAEASYAKEGRADAGGAACLWTITGQARYGAGWQKEGPPFACPLVPGTLCFSRVRQGFAANAAADAQTAYGHARVVETLSGWGQSRRMTLRVFVPGPMTFAVHLPPGVSDVRVNALPLAALPTPPRLVARQWRTGETVDAALTAARPDNGVQYRPPRPDNGEPGKEELPSPPKLGGAGLTAAPAPRHNKPQLL